MISSLLRTRTTPAANILFASGSVTKPNAIIASPNETTWNLKTNNGNGSFDNTDIQFLDSLTGFLVNGNGDVYKTIDGASSWTKVVTLASTSLNVIKFLDFNVGYTGGNKLWKTNDTGQTWTQILEAPTMTIYDINIINQDIILLFGKNASNQPRVYKTINGGTVWSDITPSTLASSTGNAWNGFCLTDQTIYIINKGSTETVYKTTNGGTTWTNVGPNPGTTTWEFNRIVFVDTNTAYLVGGTSNTVLIVTTTAPIIYKTTNGGTSWTNVTPGILSNSFLKDVVITSATNAVTVGQSGLILRTTNTGTTWATQTSPTGQDLLNISNIGQFIFVPTLSGLSTIMASGFDPSLGVNNTIETSKDFNPIFSLATSIPNSSLYDTWMADASYGYALVLGQTSGVNELWRTGDGAVTWTKIKTFASNESLYVLTGITKDEIYLAGSNNSTAAAYVVKVTNASTGTQTYTTIYNTNTLDGSVNDIKAVSGSIYLLTNNYVIWSNNYFTSVTNYNYVTPTYTDTTGTITPQTSPSADYFDVKIDATNNKLAYLVVNALINDTFTETPPDTGVQVTTTTHDIALLKLNLTASTGVFQPIIKGGTYTQRTQANNAFNPGVDNLAGHSSLNVQTTGDLKGIVTNVDFKNALIGCVCGIAQTLHKNAYTTTQNVTAAQAVSNDPVLSAIVALINSLGIAPTTILITNATLTNTIYAQESTFTEASFIAHTVDGGINWSIVFEQVNRYVIASDSAAAADFIGTPVRSPAQNINQEGQTVGRVNAVLYTDVNQCFCVGGEGLILRSDNLGTTWATVQGNATYDLYLLAGVSIP